MSISIHRDYQERIMEIVDNWMEENERNKSFNFVENIYDQIVTKNFLTKKQFEVLQEIIPELNNYTPLYRE